MKMLFSATRLVLARGELMRLEGAQGTRILSQGGRVWITQDGDPRDVVLEPGEAFDLDRPTLAIVQAIEAATIAIAEPRRSRPSWFDRAARLAPPLAWIRPAPAAAAVTA